MRAPSALLALAAASLSACGDPSAPTTNFNLSVFTTGVDEDPDGYLVFIGDAAKRVANPTARFELVLEPGTYELRISDLAPNCAVQGPATASVTITAGAPTDAGFRVECRSVAGMIEVSAPTLGRDYPLNGYSIAVTDPSGASWLIAAKANGATDVGDLAPGQYELRFAATEGNCSLSGLDTRTVTVTAGGLTRDTARVEFPVTCARTTGDVRLSVATSGEPRYTHGYELKVDGVQVYLPGDWGGFGPDPWVLPLNGSYVVERLAPGNHTIEVGMYAPNCTLAGANPRTVAVTLGSVFEESVNVTCH